MVDQDVRLYYRIQTAEKRSNKGTFFSLVRCQLINIERKRKELCGCQKTREEIFFWLFLLCAQLMFRALLPRSNFYLHVETEGNTERPRRE